MRRSPVSVGPQTIVGELGEARRDGFVFVHGELWRARAADGEPLRPGPAGAGRGRRARPLARRRAPRRGVGSPRHDCRDRRLPRPPLPARPLPDLRDQGGARVRARNHLPPRAPAAGAEGAGPLPPDPGRRPDGQGRPPDDHAEHPAAGGHHQGQRAGAGERGRLLPDRRAEERDRPGRELHGRDLPDRPDDAPVGPRPAPPRRAAVGARQDQRDPAGDHRRGHLALGHQGRDRRGQGRRDSVEHAARDGTTGRGRARAAREGDRRRGRVPGLREAEGRGAS